jgi:hypothetical protein
LENVDLEQDCTDFLQITRPPPKLVTRIKKYTWKEKFTPLYCHQDNWNTSASFFHAMGKANAPLPAYGKNPDYLRLLLECGERNGG